jgi:thiol:disulfide interchange protein DsbD
VGVHIVLEPGWYIYWTNPGDAGLPPELRWQLPEGFKASAPRYPVPEKIRYGGLAVYGFHDEVLILGEISAEHSPAAGEKTPFTALLDWMACRESCIVGRETLTVSPAGLTPAEIRRAGDIRSRFSRRFPIPADGSLATAAATVTKSPRGWIVELSFSGEPASRIRDFYPHPIEGFVIDHSRISVSAGKVRIPLTPSSASAGLAVVSGILIVDSTGYEIKVPVRSGMDSPG